MLFRSINGDAQGISTFRWLRNGVAIVGATASTYTLVVADQGTSIKFEVTPVATVAPTTGTPVASSAFPVIAAVAPTASGVTITEAAQTVGQVLTGNYTYADANGDPQGISTFRWLRNGVAIVGATASTYTLVTADLSTSITFEVTPVATIAPTTGTPVVSSAFTPVIANDGDVPTLPEWATIIFGMLLLGTTLWKQRQSQG